MNQNINRYIYFFITICVIIIVAKLFISILPYVLVIIAITYCIRKIKQFINNRNINATKSNSEFNNNNIHESFESQYTTGEVIDVEYEDVNKK